MEPFVWSARSQRSVLEERQLEENLESCRQLIKHFSKHIENFEKVVEFQTTNAIRGDGMADHFLPMRTLDLQSFKMQLSSYESRRASTEARINELVNPSRAQQEQRASDQARLADLAAKRLETDRRVDRVLQELHRLLQERAALTAAMAELGTAVDFTFGPDGLDEARFKTLAASLPESVVPASEKGAAGFLGNGQRQS